MLQYESPSRITKKRYKPKYARVLYLDNEGTKDNTTEDEVVEDAFKDIPFTMDFAGIDLIEKLHQYKGIEYNGVVFRGSSVERCIPAAVDIKDFLSYRSSQRQCVQINGFTQQVHMLCTLDGFLPAKSRVKMVISWNTP